MSPSGDVPLFRVDDATLREVLVDPEAAAARVEALAAEDDAASVAERTGLLLILGRLDEAEELARAAVDRARAGGDSHGVAAARVRLGAVLQRRGRTDDAEAELAAALADAGRLADERLRAFALQQRGIGRFEDGRLRDAERDVTAALQVLRRIGAPVDEIESSEQAVAATVRRALRRDGAPHEAAAVDAVTPLTRGAASEAVGHLGWRYVLGTLCTTVAVGSLAQGLDVARRCVGAGGEDAGGSLRVDVRADRLLLLLQSARTASVTALEVDLARRVSSVLSDSGLRTVAALGGSRAVQRVEVAVDALDIAAVRPFWRAVLGYVDEPGHEGPTDPVVDPYDQGPAVWFQQMDTPRPQRNRIHLDVSVPHDEASSRIAAALAAGGVLVSDAEAPAFWVLADVEGNEVCVTTWQGRD